VTRAPGTDRVSLVSERSIDSHIDDLATFISASPSPFHAVETAANRLKTAGFTERSATERWKMGPAGRSYVRRGGALVAWIDAEDRLDIERFRIVGAHTDSPNLRVRPKPDHVSVGFRQLGVEIYGGVLLNSWLDRDLGLSGRIGLTDPNGLVSFTNFRWDEPLLRIPQLAIHLDRQVSTEGLRLDPQQHMIPVWGLDDADNRPFAHWLGDVMGVSPDRILSWDLMAHDLTGPARIGRDRSLFASSRIDNLLSCHSAITALVECVQQPQTIPVVCLFDHEEVGSESSTGAAGSFLPAILERIAASRGLSRTDWLTSLQKSLCVSADGAHATHPNYPNRHEPDHNISLNGGPVLKHNVNTRYATDGEGAAYVRSLANQLGIELQDFVSRNDIPCGSTIGPVTSAQLGLTTVDIGVAQLSMHSARELCGAADTALFTDLLAGFLSAK